MKIPVGLGGKPGMDTAVISARFQIIVDYMFNKIRSRLGIGLIFLAGFIGDLFHIYFLIIYRIGLTPQNIALLKRYF